MQLRSIFHFNSERILLLLGDALLIALAVALSYAVAFIGESSLLLSIEGFYSVLLYWLGTLLVFAYGGLYAKPTTDFSRKKFKWLAMMNTYVVGAVFLTEYVLDPEIWLFALVFMLASFIVRTITSTCCVLQGNKTDLTMIAVIPFVIGAIVTLTLTPKILPFASGLRFDDFRACHLPLLPLQHSSALLGTLYSCEVICPKRNGSVVNLYNVHPSPTP